MVLQALVGDECRSQVAVPLNKCKACPLTPVGIDHRDGCIVLHLAAVIE